MKQKVIIGVIVILVLIVGVFFYIHNQRKQVVYQSYQDTKNKMEFDKPEAWFAGSSEGYVRVSEDSDDSSKPSILVKIEYPESIIEALGLDKGEQVVIGGKTMVRVDIQRDVPAIEGKAATTITYSDLLWSAPDGRKIIFEISPWQKPTIDKSIVKFLETFQPLSK